MERTIYHGGEYWTMNEKGEIKRFTTEYSKTWRVCGAAEYNNFGHLIRFYELNEILTDPRSIPWFYKNGKQRVFVHDYDHGTQREWRCPPHYII